MIWSKTDAGRTEMQARALVKERAQRNLLLVIDGIKTEEMLLGNLAGITAADFAALHSLGLIAPMGSSASGSRSGGSPSARAVPAAPVADPVPVDYAQFTEALTQMISRELGLRGFVLTLAVEKAGTIEELQAVATRTLAQIAERKGEPAAAAARRTLYGG
ncbi:MAG: hypothetical protein H7Y61_20890 [Rhizobiales bacterium]|nr:hypothetical protein [Rhizobacter sp.]